VKSEKLPQLGREKKALQTINSSTPSVASKKALKQTSSETLTADCTKNSVLKPAATAKKATLKQAVNSSTRTLLNVATPSNTNEPCKEQKLSKKESISKKLKSTPARSKHKTVTFSDAATGLPTFKVCNTEHEVAGNLQSKSAVMQTPEKEAEGLVRLFGAGKHAEDEWLVDLCVDEAGKQSKAVDCELSEAELQQIYSHLFSER